MATGGIGNLPRSTRRYTFALTPLADAMFQLLIFFMLTSNLTPYSLITLQSGPGSTPSATEERTNAQPQPATAQSAIWRIDNGGIVSNGQYFGFDRLLPLANALKAAGTPQVVLVSTPSAQVQDLAFVLEKLTAAGIGQIQIVSQVYEGEKR